MLVLLPTGFQLGGKAYREIVHERVELVEDRDDALLLLPAEGQEMRTASNIGLRVASPWHEPQLSTEVKVAKAAVK